MHQQVPSTDAYRHREHKVLELLRRDRARVWDWDVDVGDFRSSVYGLFPAERNDGVDALRIGTPQLLRIFEAAEIEPFPNLRHWSPGLERHEPAASLSPTPTWRKNSQRHRFGPCSTPNRIMRRLGNCFKQDISPTVRMTQGIAASSRCRASRRGEAGRLRFISSNLAGCSLVRIVEE